MKRSDVSDLQVLEAVIAGARDDARGNFELLMSATGAPMKIAGAALERAYGRGLIEVGTSLNRAWITPKGWDLARPGHCEQCGLSYEECNARALARIAQTGR